MKKIVLFFAQVIITTSLLAQGSSETAGTRPTNSIYLNVFGDASMVSVNYERVFLIKDAFILTGKLGAGYYKEIPIWENQSTPPKYFTIPHHITGNFGKRQHFFEFGLGGTFLHNQTDNIYIVYPIVGYRLHPLESNKLNFRIYGQFPVAGSNWATFWFIPIGLSFGIGF